MVNKKVYIVLVNYNGSEDTIECITSILKSSYKFYDILVVDNCSTDNSYEHLYNELKIFNNIKFCLEDDYMEETDSNSIVLFKAKKNNGFGAGCNIATNKLAYNNFRGYVWYLNNDTSIDEFAMENFVIEAQKSDKAVLGSTLVKYNTDKIQCFGGGYINKLIGFQNYYGEDESLDYVKNNTKKLEDQYSGKLDYIVGASIFLPIEILTEYGNIPEHYFLYWEETDFCYGLKKAGLDLKWIPNSIVYHKIGSSTDITSSFTDYYSTRNTIRFFKKWHPFFLISIVLFNILFKVFNRIRRGQFKRIFLIFKAVFDGLKRQ